MPGLLSPLPITLAETDITKVLVLVGIMVAVIVVTTVALLLVRKRLLAAGARSAGEAGVMEEMRRLHGEGKLSDAEFQAVRARMAAKMKDGTAFPQSGNLKRTKVIDTGRPVIPTLRPPQKPPRNPPAQGQ